MFLSILIFLSLTPWSEAFVPVPSAAALSDYASPAALVDSTFALSSMAVENGWEDGKEDGLMAFESLCASFGTVKDDSGEQLMSCRFVNNSGSSLAITAIVPTCPCIKATSDKSIYPEGAEGAISIAFNPWRMSGKVDLKVLVYTELAKNAPTAVLRVEGDVIVSDPWDYLPVKVGKLRLKTDKAVFAEGEKVVRILCANTSNEDLQPVTDLVPEGVSACFEPAVIPPQSEADLVIRAEKPVRGGFTICTGERDVLIVKLMDR